MIFIVDANILMHTFWAYKEDDRPDIGHDIVDRFLTRLDRLHGQLGSQFPDCQWVCVFDNPHDGFRHWMLPVYKSGRTKDLRLDEAIETAKGAVGRDQNWICLTAPYGFESDDLIATIAKKHTGNVVIHSSDKDMHACLEDGRVAICKESKLEKVTDRWGGEHYGNRLEFEWFTYKDFYGKFKIFPQQWLDYLCLNGDQGDTVTGAVGIGPKTIAKILASDYARLEDIDIEEIPGIKKNQIEGFQDMVLRLPKLRRVLGLITELDWPRELTNEEARAEA